MTRASIPGMTRVRSGQVPAWPLSSDRSGRRDSRVKRQQMGGQYDAAFTMKTYVHASDEDLQQGTRRLSRIHKLA